MEFSIETPKYSFNCELNSKINIVCGHSGSGKTELLKAAYDKKYDDIRRVKLSEGVKLYNNNDFLSDNFVEDKSSLWLVILDESIELRKNSTLVNRINQTTNFYYLIMTRKYTEAISCDVDAVYDIVPSGKFHDLVKKFPHYDGNRRLIAINTVICEDSGIGYQWFKKLYSNKKVITANGNAGMRKSLREEAEKGDSILLIMDLSAFGSFFEDLRNVGREFNCSIQYVPTFKSFEYMLLQSNLFNCIGEDRFVSERDLLKYQSTEKAYEHRLMEVTKGLDGMYINHDKPPKHVPKCYIEYCCYMTDEIRQAERGRCNYRLLSSGKTEDKLTLMLKGTEFECMINVREV